jgi:hypothetical protein
MLKALPVVVFRVFASTWGMSVLYSKSSGPWDGVVSSPTSGTNNIRHLGASNSPNTFTTCLYDTFPFKTLVNTGHFKGRGF